MRRWHLLVLPVAALLLAFQAKASVMTYDISFTASGAFAASGSYTLTFDPTLGYPDTVTGLTVTSFAGPYTPLASVAFDYIPGKFNGELVFGGTLNGVSGIADNTDDYALVITNFSTTPSFGEMYATSTSASGHLLDTAGTVSVATVTPEPSGFILLGTGLLGVVAVARRRYC